MGGRGGGFLGNFPFATERGTSDAAGGARGVLMGAPTAPPLEGGSGATLVGAAAARGAGAGPRGLLAGGTVGGELITPRAPPCLSQ